MRIEGKRVALSGPMSGIDGYNVPAFVDAHLLLKELGAAKVYDPAVEYLLQGAREDGEMEHHDYVRRCLHELTRSLGTDGEYDVLVQLPGWEESKGARAEAVVARACNIEVVGLGECE